jgi:hypothetical protein
MSLPSVSNGKNNLGERDGRPWIKMKNKSLRQEESEHNPECKALRKG